MEEDLPLNYGENHRSDGGRQLTVPSSTYSEDSEYVAAEEQLTVFISGEETMSELKKRLHIEQNQTVVFVNSNDLEENEIAREEKKFQVAFTFARVEFKDMLNPEVTVKGYIAVQSDIDMKSGELFIDKKETEVSIAEMVCTEKSWKGSNSKCVVFKHDKTGKKIACKCIKKRVSVNEVIACLDVQDTNTSPKIYCIKEEENIEIFMELIVPKVSLNYVINKHMPWILEKGLAKSFVYYIINILLIAVNEVHSKGWSHCDLHGANILLQKDNDRIIVRIIDFGSAKEITDNRRGHQNKKDDLRTMSERITSLSRRCKGIEDELLNRFRGDDPKTISSTEEAEMVIEETSARAKKFVRTDDNIVVMERIFTMVGTTRPISDSDISEEMETMNSKSSPPSSSDDYPYGSSSEEKSKEISPNPSTEEAMEYTTVGI